MKKYNITNNGYATLELPISDSDTTILLAGPFETLPTSNFILKITHREAGEVKIRENVYVTNRVGSTCTGVIRAYEPVPMNETSERAVQQAYAFDAGDIVECTISAEIVKDLQNEFERFRGIPDKRHSPFPEPREIISKSTGYEFRPINSGEAGQLSIPGEQVGWAVVETISGWTFDTGEGYIRQIAYRVNPRVNQIYIRFGKTQTEWGDWERVYPANLNSNQLATMISPLSGQIQEASNQLSPYSYWNNAEITMQKATGVDGTIDLGEVCFVETFYGHFSSRGSSTEGILNQVQISNDNVSWENINVNARGFYYDRNPAPRKGYKISINKNARYIKIVKTNIFLGGFGVNYRKRFNGFYLSTQTAGPNNKFDVLTQGNQGASINIGKLSETLGQETTLNNSIYKVKNTGLLSTNNENSIGAIVKDGKIFAYNDFSSNNIIFDNLAYTSQEISEGLEIVCGQAYFSQGVYNVVVNGERRNSLNTTIYLHSLLENGTKILSVTKQHTANVERSGDTIWTSRFEIIVKKSGFYQVQMRADGQVDKITFSF